MNSLKRLRSISEGKYILVERCRGKKVLEIGCVNHSLDELKQQMRQGNWLFGFLNEVASKAVGIDVSKEPVAYLKKKGYDVRIADAQNFNLDEQFEVIVVSGVTDHLLNFSGFFSSSVRHLTPDGELLIFEDNVLSIPALIQQRIEYLFKGSNLGMHNDITVKPLPFTFANYVGNFGLEVKELRYVARRRTVKIITKLIPALIRPDELLFDHFLCVLTKKDD